MVGSSDTAPDGRMVSAPPRVSHSDWPGEGRCENSHLPLGATPLEEEVGGAAREKERRICRERSGGGSGNVVHFKLRKLKGSRGNYFGWLLV